MNKTISTPLAIIIIVVCAVLVGGIMFWQYLEIQKEKEIPEGQSEDETPNWEKHTKGTYRNEEYGFQLIMPSSWKNYATKKERENQSIIIEFGLPLKSDEISQWLPEPKRAEKIFEIWSLYIIPIPEWESARRSCEDPAVDYPCFYPAEIARNEKYVFGSGLYFIAGGWDPCLDENVKKKETYFCSVYWDMSSTRSIQGYDIKEAFSLLSE